MNIKQLPKPMCIYSYRAQLPSMALYIEDFAFFERYCLKIRVLLLELGIYYEFTLTVTEKICNKLRNIDYIMKLPI